MRIIGMDIHQRQTVFHVLDENGSCVDFGKVESESSKLQEVIKRHAACGVRVAIEASTPAFWVRDALVAAGAKVEVTNPYKLRLIAESRSKTDKSDARILAELLRCGGLPREVYVPGKEIQCLREQLAIRRGIIGIRTKLICSAKASLRRRGIKYEAKAFHKNASWTGDAHGLDLIERLGRIYQRCEEERVAIEKEMQAKWKSDPRFDLLRSIPGVGPIVGLTLLAAIEKIERFQHPEHLASYAGLVPSERSSGETVSRGGITHQGRNELRGAIVQAAWAVLRTKHGKADALKKMFYKVMLKRNSQVAVIAVARKLLTIAHQVLKHGVYFDDQLVGKRPPIQKRAERKISSSSKSVCATMAGALG